MKIEYDTVHDLLYVWLAAPGTPSVNNVTVAPGVFTDFDANGKLIGLEVLDASEILGKQAHFEVVLTSANDQSRQIRSGEPA
jgi:uncharacterized protein YuzE